MLISIFSHIKYNFYNFYLFNKISNLSQGLIIKYVKVHDEDEDENEWNSSKVCFISIINSNDNIINSTIKLEMIYQTN